MPEMNIIQAINNALFLEMERDERVVVLGEDVGFYGGVFRATVGLQKKFGEARAMDTPLAEAGIIATSIGMALNGLRPVPEIQFADFIFPAYDQIINELVKYRYRSGGAMPCPVTIRTPYGGGIKGGHYHSQSPESVFIHHAGIKVVVPSDPYEAKGLLLSSIRDENPVLFMEPKRVYRASKAEVPEGEYTIPLGKAKVDREGKDVTVIAWGAMLHVAREAAAKAEENGVSCDLIDLRTLWPLDIETLVASAEKTGRVVIVQEAPRACGLAAEITSLLMEKVFLSLEAPIQRVTGMDTPFPYSLEHEYLPDAGRVWRGIRAAIDY